MTDAPKDPHPPARRGLPASVWLLGLTSFFTDVGSEMAFPLLPALVVSLGGGSAFVGLIEGVADAVSSVLKLLSGAWSDRLGSRKGLVVAGYGLASLARPLFALATAPWHVLAVRVTDRVGKGLRSSPRDALISRSVAQDQAGRAFGLHRAMDHAGAVVGPLVATGLLALGLTVPQVLLWTVLPGALAVACTLAVRDPKDPPAPDAPRAAAAPPAPMSRTLRRFLAVLLLFALANASDAFVLLRAKELGWEVALLPLLWTLLHVSKLLSNVVGGRLADRFDRARLVALGWLVYAGSYVGFAAAHARWQVLPLLLAYGCFYGLTEPAEKALVKQLAPAARGGRAFGAYHFVLGLAAIPAGLLTGGLWDAFGAPVALLTSAGLALVAAALVLTVRPGPVPA